nr:MAG TPA: hypothetical protein [Caudoviricetes sp.]DAU95824.1 MAG TPA: hypothetical protein [Caudoviricetes sp.]
MCFILKSHVRLFVTTVLASAGKVLMMHLIA